MTNSRHKIPDPLDVMRGFDPVDAAALRADLDDDAIDQAMAMAIGMGKIPAGGEAAAPGPSSVSVAPASSASGSRSASIDDAPGVRHDPRRRARRRRSARPLVIGAALVVLIAAALLVTGVLSGGDGSHPSYAAAAVEVAEANPRLLVTAPGWRVTGAGEFEADQGEMGFGDGSRQLELNWYPARLYRGYLRDRAQVSPPRRSRLLGRTTTTVEYRRGEYATILAPMGPVFLELRGDLGDLAAYESVLHSLRQVDVDTWLGAMPASVIQPDARAPVVDHMLRGVPYPPGFDPSGLEAETAVLDHYDLGVRVADAVACGWVESYLAARDAGDADAERRAVAAMSSSHRWPLLRQMEREVKGGWAHNIWTVAGWLRAGHLHQDFGEGVVNADGTGYMLGPAWATALECHDAIRRKPFVSQKPPGR
jgi:hypothetical protein